MEYELAAEEEVMVEIRKIITMREVVLSELGVAAPRRAPLRVPLAWP